MSALHPLDHSLAPPTHIGANPSRPVPALHDPAQPQPHMANGRPHPSLFGMDDPAPDTSETLVDAGQPAKHNGFDRFESPAGSFPTIRNEGWEEAFERQKKERYREKVEEDLRGWRGGNGEPRSGYSQEAVPTNSYYGQPVTGVIGRHLPKEIVRIDRDWSDGEVCQFQSAYPMELEGRITPAQWTGFIEGINDRMTAAYSVKGAVVDNLIAIASWWTSLFWRTSHFEKNLQGAESDITKANQDLFNPVGLNVLSPRHNALQFMEIEYY